MAREFSRTRRLGEQIQRDLAQIIQREVKDPRLGMVTVSGVELSRDLGHAKVYVTVMGEGADIETSLTILNKVAGFLRHELGRHIVARTIPQLHFHYDESVERGAALSKLIDDVVAPERHEDED